MLGPMGRPKNQTLRRQQLLEATRAAIIEHGIGDVGVRDIAKAAGMSPGSITYYYPALDDLLQQVQADAAERFATQRWELVRTIADPRQRLMSIIEHGVAAGPDDELMCLLNEFTGLARRNPAYRAQWKSLFERQVAIYESVLTTGQALGTFELRAPALQIAHNLVGLEDVYAFHVVTGASFTRQEAIELILGYARIATGCEDLAPSDAAEAAGPIRTPSRTSA